MKKFALKSVILAVGALAGASAFAAAVDLDATSPVSIKYANEMVISTSANLRHGAAADQTATTTFGASFGTDVTAYVRVDLAGGTFAGTPAATMFAVQDSNNAAATVSVAQSGTGYVIFAVTPTSTFNLASAKVATIDTDTGTATGLTVTDKTGVTLRYRLFETLTAAANPSSSNTLKDTGAVSYVAFSNALTTTITSNSKTADVAASPSYTAFTNNTGSLAKIAITLNTVAEADGSALTAAELLTANSDITVNGDFTFAKNDAGTYTGAALSRVFLNDDADCTAGAKTVAAVTTLSATTATFSNIAAATLTDDHWLCVTPEGTPEIAAASYNVDINYEPQTAYALSDITGSASGSVSRNGVRMVAPLVQTTSGFLSRLVMTNTGSSERSYTISAVSENGVTTVLSGAGASGTLAAGKTTVIEVPNVAAITGATRTSLVVTVNAPQSEIDGLYQIVNTTSFAISNYLLSYKN